VPFPEAKFQQVPLQNRLVAKICVGEVEGDKQQINLGRLRKIVKKYACKVSTKFRKFQPISSDKVQAKFSGCTPPQKFW
jgi:hypothetical protein